MVLFNNTITVNGLMSRILAFTLSNTPVPAGIGLTATGNLVLNDPDDSSSAVTIDRGTLTVGGNGRGLARLTVEARRHATLDNTTAHDIVNPRIDAGVSVTLNGDIHFLGNAPAASGRIHIDADLNSGHSVISSLRVASQALVFNTFAQHGRHGHLPGNRRNIGSVSNGVIFTNLVTLTGTAGDLFCRTPWW